MSEEIKQYDPENIRSSNQDRKSSKLSNQQNMLEIPQWCIKEDLDSQEMEELLSDGEKYSKLEPKISWLIEAIYVQKKDLQPGTKLEINENISLITGTRDSRTWGLLTSREGQGDSSEIQCTFYPLTRDSSFHRDASQLDDELAFCDAFYADLLGEEWPAIEWTREAMGLGMKLPMIMEEEVEEEGQQVVEVRHREVA